MSQDNPESSTTKIVFSSFQEFFYEVLSPSGKYSRVINSDFIYRGEKSNSASFKLIPSALREVNTERLKEMAGQEGMIYANQKESQINNEYLVIRDFYHRANKQGLKVPINNDFDVEIFNDNVNMNIVASDKPLIWIAPEYTEIAALAQHYGVPTRLIDWTSDVYVALYFASIGALYKIANNKTEPNENIVVWALDAGITQRRLPGSKGIPLKLVIPKYSDNPNLNAQKGVLSYWEITHEPSSYRTKELYSNVSHPTLEHLEQITDDYIGEVVDRRPLDELLAQHKTKTFGFETPVTVLYKFELPILEAISAYGYIRKIGYTAGRLFPGYAGITKEMEENLLFKHLKKSKK